MKTEENCVYAACVDCPVNSRHCTTCGWNPDVHKKRVEKIRIEHSKKV